MNVAPGAEYTAEVNWGATGATIGLTVYLGDAVAVSRVTGFTEVPPGSGIYVLEGLTAPDDAGSYTLLFDDDGGIAAVGHNATDELNVTSSAFSAASPAAGDLATVADVRASMETEAGDTDLDALIQTYITTASGLIQQETQRELAVTGSATRDFAVRGRIVSLSPYDLRAVTTMTADPNSGGSVLAANGDYTLAPVGGRSLTSTFTEVMLASPPIGELGGQADGRLRIAGTWGPAAVPALARDACVFTVRAWLRRSFGQGYNLGDLARDTTADLGFEGFAIPLAAKQMLGPLYRHGSRSSAF